MALNYLLRRDRHEGSELAESWIEPRLGPVPLGEASEVFDTGRKTIVDCAHVKVERLETHPVLFSKVFKEFEDRKGHKYDYRYWAERENYFLREFLKKQHQFTHVVQARHLISEDEAAKQVLTCDAGITISNWLRVKPRYADTATLSHPFQRADAFLRLIRACLVALKEIHEHRIVHCDIKEDNICIPYAPNPFPGDGQAIHLEFEKLKLIDFAFSVAHAIPLTQVLVIDPDERLPYQSDLLIAALHADRKSGSPNAVQQLDYRVDLYSLGYLAGKIAEAGLVCPGEDRDAGSGVLEDIGDLIRGLKAFDSAPNDIRLPHDRLIARIDCLLAATAGHPAPLQFRVDGEWTADEMEHGHITGQQTPLTPVALPLPTPVARPVTPAPRPLSNASRTGYGLFAGLVLAFALAFGLAAALFYQSRLLPPEPAAVAAPAPQPPAPPSVPEPERLAAAHDNALASKAYAERSRAFRSLVELAQAGNQSAAQRVAAFETGYDKVKQTVAKSAWWARGQGVQPDIAARWIEDGRLLAEFGDRPAMLDVAFATGYGRGVALDRVTAVETYLKVIARSDATDENSARIRQSALRGLAAMLNAIVEQKDRPAAERLQGVLVAQAAAGSAGVQYYLGLMSECVAQPADLDAAREWYRQAAADPVWKATAERKAQLLGRWCPRPAG